MGPLGRSPAQASLKMASSSSAGRRESRFGLYSSGTAAVKAVGAQSSCVRQRAQSARDSRRHRRGRYSPFPCAVPCCLRAVFQREGACKRARAVDFAAPPTCASGASAHPRSRSTAPSQGCTRSLTIRQELLSRALPDCPAQRRLKPRSRRSRECERRSTATSTRRSSRLITASERATARQRRVISSHKSHAGCGGAAGGGGRRVDR